MTAGDVQAISNMLRRAAWIHVEAVKDGAVVEFEPGKLKSTRTCFSADDRNRERQHSHLWHRGVQALKDSGMAMPTARVGANWLLPFRRRRYAESVFPELRRVNDIVDRLRVGVMQILIDELGCMQCSTGEGYDASQVLMRAIVDYDYPMLADIAASDPLLRDGLRDALGLVDQEIAAMASLDGPEWQALGESDQRVDTYYSNVAAG